MNESIRRAGRLLRQATALALSALLLPANARAQTSAQEEFEFFESEAEIVQNTVSRINEKADEAPGSVYVYTRETIATHGYRSLGELLQTVPGFSVFHRDLAFVAGVRGLNANDNEKVTLLLNGQNINGVIEPDYLNGPINLDNVERVEVVVGPSSFFQQANTLAATVNVITRDAKGLEVLGSVGSDLPYSGTIMAGKRWADKSVSASFTTERKNGFKAFDKSYSPILAGQVLPGELDWPSFFGVVKGRSGDWTTQFAAYRDKRPELNLDKGFPGVNGIYTDQIYSGSLADEHAWTPDLTSVFKVDAADKEQSRLNADGTTPLDGVQLQIKQLDFSGELGLRYTGFERQTIQAGLQGSYQDNYDDWFTYVQPGTDNFQKTPFITGNNNATGVYLDDTAALNERLKLVGGVRLDDNTEIGAKLREYVGARAAVIGRPLESQDLVSKLIFNRTVRFPSAAGAGALWGTAHLANSPSFAKSSPNAAQPEILSTFELQNILYVGKFRANLNVYHEELTNFITWFQPWSNVGNFHGNGVELSVQEKIDKRNSLWGNVSWNYSKLTLFHTPVDATGAPEAQHTYANARGRIIGSPEYVANVGCDSKLLPHLTLSPGLRYFTKQAGFDAGSGNFVSVDDRIYLDVGLTWDHVWDRDVDLRLSGQNILDNTSPVAMQMSGDLYHPRGADIRATLDYRF